MIEPGRNEEETNEKVVFERFKGTQLGDGGGAGGGGRVTHLKPPLSPLCLFVSISLLSYRKPPLEI